MKKSLLLLLPLLAVGLTSCYSEKTHGEFLDQVKENAARTDQPSYTKAIETIKFVTVKIETDNSLLETMMKASFPKQGDTEVDEMSPASARITEAEAASYATAESIKYYISSDGGLKLEMTRPGDLFDGLTGATGYVYTEYDKFNYSTKGKGEVKFDGDFVEGPVSAKLKFHLVLEVSYSYN